MALTPAEAQTALKDIEQTENRAAASHHGRVAAPYLFVWGLIWIIGYIATGLKPGISWIWLALSVVGVAASLLLANGQARAGQRSPGFAWRYFGSAALIAISIGAYTSINPPADFNQASAVAPMVVGAFYGFIGLWSKGWRMLPLGVALIALTVLGYFVFPGLFAYWMAAVGGGGLIIGGIWLRSV